MNAQPYLFEFRVCYADTDAGGVVYHARYIEILERARYEHMRHHGVDIAELAAGGIYLAIVDMHIKYLTPGKLGELLQVRTWVDGAKKVSFECRQEIWTVQQPRHLCSANVRVGCVDAALKPLRLPEKLAAILAS